MQMTAPSAAQSASVVKPTAAAAAAAAPVPAPPTAAACADHAAASPGSISSSVEVLMDLWQQGQDIHAQYMVFSPA